MWFRNGKTTWPIDWDCGLAGLKLRTDGESCLTMVYGVNHGPAGNLIFAPLNFFSTLQWGLFHPVLFLLSSLAIPAFSTLVGELNLCIRVASDHRQLDLCLSLYTPSSLPWCHPLPVDLPLYPLICVSTLPVYAFLSPSDRPSIQRPWQTVQEINWRRLQQNTHQSINSVKQQLFCGRFIFSSVHAKGLLKCPSLCISRQF